MKWNKNKKSEVDYLLKRQSSIISVFTQTQQDLTNLNDEASQVITMKQEEINQLNTELGLLNNMISANSLVISKIDSFLKP